MCFTSKILVFVITDYLITSLIIGMSVAILKDENDDVHHSGEALSTMEQALSGMSVDILKDENDDVHHSGEFLSTMEPALSVAILKDDDDDYSGDFISSMDPALSASLKID
ncbi:uncharacterized protein LOC128237056 [Mya arenaria]|uniref:uncharacterized protein LOC128237056 n=1 Tax=Mya arenaria TaxID=6604 RepID=UPI0022E3258D|nr:uncharacterized protein LOC128237056 [Mya arenaria]